MANAVQNMVQTSSKRNTSFQNHAMTESVKQALGLADISLLRLRNAELPSDMTFARLRPEILSTLITD
jgi:hypothetical protein